jgi:SAM-dependent methyltransferase
MPSLTDLLKEASSRPVTGWDFSWLGNRLSTRPLEWSFESVVKARSRHATNLLDMSTGGGEWLAALDHRPRRTVATEGWPPNVIVAHARLRPLGISVVWSEDAPDNVDQGINDLRGRLPFRDGSFTLITNRHASFAAAEVSRVLSKGGTFLTEQVGGDYRDVYDALGLRGPEHIRPWNSALAINQILEGGLRIVEARDGTLVTEFADVGAFAWYLKAVPWPIPTFTIEAYRPALERLHERLRREGPLPIRMPAFFLEATK